jgi:hypothetical protein
LPIPYNQHSSPHKSRILSSRCSVTTSNQNLIRPPASLHGHHSGLHSVERLSYSLYYVVYYWLRHSYFGKLLRNPQRLERWRIRINGGDDASDIGAVCPANTARTPYMHEPKERATGTTCSSRNRDAPVLVRMRNLLPLWPLGSV